MMIECANDTCAHWYSVLR